MRTIYLNDKAIEALKRGEFIAIDVGDFWCKLEKYDIDEQIENAFGGVYISLNQILKRRKDENSCNRVNAVSEAYDDIRFSDGKQRA